MQSSPGLHGASHVPSPTDVHLPGGQTDLSLLCYNKYISHKLQDTSNGVTCKDHIMQRRRDGAAGCWEVQVASPSSTGVRVKSEPGWV